jgi:hypothetical protein
MDDKQGGKGWNLYLAGALTELLLAFVELTIES